MEQDSKQDSTSGTTVNEERSDDDNDTVFSGSEGSVGEARSDDETALLEPTVDDEAQEETPSGDDSLASRGEIDPAVQLILDNQDSFYKKLEWLAAKRETCKGSAIYDAVNTLHAALINAADQFFSNESHTQTMLSEFSRACHAAMDKARPALETQRDCSWKQFFADIACLIVSIATLGTANLVSKAFTGSFTFFKTETDLMRSVDDIKKDITPLPVARLN